MGKTPPSVDNRTVFVCCKQDFWAKAVCTVIRELTTFVTWPVFGVAPDVIKNEMARHGRYPDRWSDDVCVVRVQGAPEEMAARCLPIVWELRTKGPYWPGGIITVVNNQEAKHALERSDLCGGNANGPTAYCRLAAHGVLCDPLHVSSLLQELAKVDAVYELTWNEWLKSGLLYDLWHRVCEVELYCDAGQCSDMEIAAKQLHMEWNCVDWKSVHMHGDAQREVIGLAHSPVPRDCSAIADWLKRMKTILMHLGIGVSA